MEKLAILPAYNLANSIEDIISRTKKFVDVVILISDGSNDNTHLKAKTAGAKCPPHTNIRGKGFAIRKGIEFSKKFKPKYIVLMDADDNLITSIVADNAHLPASGWYSLTFDPDWTSAHKVYVLGIRSNNDPQDNGIRVALSIKPEYFRGKLLENGDPTEQDIIFRYGCIAGLEKLNSE